MTGRLRQLWERVLRSSVPELCLCAVVAVTLSVFYASITGALGVWDADEFAPSPNDAADVVPFAAAGRMILSGHLASAYANANMQAGPLQLVLYALLVSVFGGSPAAWVLLRALLMWSLLVTLVLGARPRNSAWRMRLTALGLAGLLCVSQVAFTFYRWGHWCHLPVYLGIVGAAGLARRDRWLWTGVVLGVASLLEPFAILGVSVLILSPRMRTALWAAIVAGAIVLVGYLPFVLSGGFAMGQKTWPVRPGTLASLVLGDGAAFEQTWGGRIIQGAAAVAVATALCWRLRTRVPSPALLLLVAAVVALARMATDSYWWGYYWIVPLVLLMAAAHRLVWLRDAAGIPVALAVVLGFVAAPFGGPLAAIGALTLIGSIGWSGWSRLVMQSDSEREHLAAVP